ncbi:MAG TPA: hypothetical protein PLD54_01885 [Candidatus Levybacteria bacterium]|nr:hypothetical protein [Candidatus Levybacteria bacterium]
MLTKEDLSAIGQIVDEKIEKQVSPINKNVKSIKSDLNKVQKDVRVMLAVLDRADVELRQRVERIEEHLGINTSQ